MKYYEVYNERTVMEGKRGNGGEEGKRTTYREKLMDWIMENGYGKLKEKARQRERWSRRIFGPAWKAANLKKNEPMITSYYRSRIYLSARQCAHHVRYNQHPISS